MRFPFVGFPGGDRQCPSVISYPADVPCPAPLSFSDVFIHVGDLGLGLGLTVAIGYISFSNWTVKSPITMV